MDWKDPDKKETRPDNDLVETENDDVLRGRFTKWLDVVLYRAKLKYLRKLSQEIETVSPLPFTVMITASLSSRHCLDISL